MDCKRKTSTRLHYNAVNLKTALQKAREILSMATLTPLNISRLQTPNGSLSDVSDCASQSSDYGYSALHDAVISHDLEYLDFLLESGSELDQRDENGFTALHVAVLQRSLVGVQRLVDAGCNLEKPTKEGMSALHIAVDLKDNEDILCFLAASTPNINIKNKVGRTALHLSAKSGHHEYIKILLDYGSDRDVKDKFGKKAIDIARTNNHGVCVEILLNYIAKKRLVSSRTSTHHNDHGENISRKNRRKKNIGTNDNESSNWSVNSVDSSIYQINVQNVDSLDRRMDSLQEQNQEGFADDNHKNAVKENSHHHNASSTSDQCCTQWETPVIYLYEIEKQLEDTMENGFENNNNIWTTSSYLSFKELESHNNKYTEESFKILPKELSTYISQTYSLQSNVSSPLSYRCRDVVKNGHHRNGQRDYQKQLVHFDPQCNGRGMFNLITAICRMENYKHEFQYNGKRCRKDCDDVRNRLQSCFVARVLDLQAQNHFYCYELLNPHLKSFSTKLSFRIDKLTSQADVLSDLLQGIKGTLNGIFGSHGNRWLDGLSGKNGYHGHDPCDSCSASVHQGNIEFLKTSPSCGSTSSYHGNSSCYGSPGCHGATGYYDTIVSRTKQCNIYSGDSLELFFTASHLISTTPDDASAILDKFCDNLDVALCKSLVCSIFSHTKPLGDLVPSHDTISVCSSNSDSVMHAFEYVLQHKKTSCGLASNALEVILTQQNGVRHNALLLQTSPEFVEKLIRAASSEETAWTEDKVAEMFARLCDLLSTDVLLLCRFVDCLLGIAFQTMNSLTLGSCILVRMGILKSEFDVKISRRLDGPLQALVHIFQQTYFPASLASLFVSFLIKPSPRFCKVERLRENALQAAMLRELLQPSMQLGKGLKRITDVLEHGDFDETALQCCKALFEVSFSAGSRFTTMEQGSSILIYLGLIKSEFPVDAMQNLKHGLKLLLHAASNNYIPQSIAPMIAIFLTKESGNILCSCKEQVEQIIYFLTQ